MCFPNILPAIMSGSCSGCHTMHNSQDGLDVAGAEPNDYLLISCIACHSGSDGQVNSYGAPVILHTTEPAGQGDNRTLAGGDFYWVQTTDANGHNVAGIADEDAALTNIPPGFDQSATTGLEFDGKTLEVTGGTGWGSNQLTCAGTFGCHGARNTAGFGGLGGAHHGNDGTSTQASAPATVSGSYRFLAGIRGLENAGWNWNETPASHNEYYGEDNTADRSAGANYGGRDTISFLCAECHGLFHGTIDKDAVTGSPWIRHPTDVALPGSGEYLLYNTADGLTTGTYSVEAPVARATVEAASGSTINPGTDIVMCLSCHRAHGSPLNDMLRFDYNMMTAGGSNTGGCFTCHTTKNTGNP